MTGRSGMPQQPLDHFAAQRKSFPIAALVDFVVLLGSVLTVNGLLLLLSWRANPGDRSAYAIAFGPANAAIALVALACTPLFIRLTGKPARIHVTLSLAVPVAAIVTWAALFMSWAP